MPEVETRSLNIKTILILVVVAIVTAVLVTLMQTLILASGRRLIDKVFLAKAQRRKGNPGHTSSLRLCEEITTEDTERRGTRVLLMLNILSNHPTPSKERRCEN